MLDNDVVVSIDLNEVTGDLSFTSLDGSSMLILGLEKEEQKFRTVGNPATMEERLRDGYYGKAIVGLIATTEGYVCIDKTLSKAFIRTIMSQRADGRVVAIDCNTECDEDPDED
jgi:hypothetical protein